MEPEDCLRAGTLLCGGKYRIVEAIGQGGFGITYKAKYRHEVQEAIGKMVVESDVAIKEFFIKSECERADDSNAVTVPSKKKAGFISDYREKFVKEAKNLSRLSHENIVKVIDIFEENSTAYFVMEYIDGESLDSLVEKHGAMSESQAKEVIGQLANAVDYIHRNKFVHYDIKPANVMLSSTNKIKLIDFGLSKHYGKDGKQTTLGITQGVSEGFSPIEQYKMGSLREFSPRTDIYSVGATMTYLLTGKVPPSATTLQLPVLPSSVSEPVKQGIYVAMAKAIEDRPNTISEFIQIIGGKLQSQTGKFKAHVDSPLITSKEDNILNNTKPIGENIFFGKIISSCLRLFSKKDKDSKINSNNTINSNNLEIIVEGLMSNKQYREAYSMCLAAVKKNEYSDYAMQKIEILVPILKEQSKKDKFKHWVVAIIITIVGFILTVISSI